MLRLMNDAPPIGDVPPVLPPSHQDRRTGLRVFGILEILLGLLCLLMAGFMVLGQVMYAQTTGVPVNIRLLLPGILFYAGVAVALVWLGIGSIQCRRWARGLMLILAWAWLSLGVMMVSMMAWLLPRIMAAATAAGGQGGQGLPPGAMVIIVIVQLIVMSVFFILLPGALVLFYRSSHVKATCEARDPVPRWTEACPLPVLAVSCMLFWGALLMLFMPMVKLGLLPFFGILLTGIPGGLAMVAMAFVFLWLALSWYRLNVAGWWTLVGVMVVFAISNVLTFSRVDLIEMYKNLGYPQAQIDQIQQQGWMTKEFMMWSALFWLVPMLGYLIWTKRFFQARTSEAMHSSPGT